MGNKSAMKTTTTMAMKIQVENSNNPRQNYDRKIIRFALIL
jgi:hypothetical protein